MSSSDFYTTLGVSKTASQDEIKKAFRDKAKEFHPDRNTDPDAESKFKAVNEAYQVLSDPEKRKQYDNPVSPVSGGFPFSGGTVTVQRRQTINAMVTLNIKDMMFGKKDCQVKVGLPEDCKTCSGKGHKGMDATTSEDCVACDGRGYVTRFAGMAQFPCMMCHGTGKITANCDDCDGKGYSVTFKEAKINVPAGLKPGNVVQLNVEGKNVLIGFDADLPENCGVDELGNLMMPIELNYAQIALGSKVDYTLPDDSKGKVSVPRNIQPGKTIRLKGSGLPESPHNVKKRGDLHLVVVLRWPGANGGDKELTPAQKQALEALEQAYQDSNNEF